MKRPFRRKIDPCRLTITEAIKAHDAMSSEKMLIVVNTLKTAYESLRLLTEIGETTFPNGNNKIFRVIEEYTVTVEAYNAVFQEIEKVVKDYDLM